MDHWHPAEFLSLQMMHFVIHCTFPGILLLRTALGYRLQHHTQCFPVLLTSSTYKNAL